MHRLCPKLRILGVGGPWPCPPFASLSNCPLQCLADLLPSLHSRSMRPFSFIPTPMTDQGTWPGSLGLGLRDSQQAGLSWGWGWGWGLRAADQTWSCLFSSCLLCSGSPRGRGGQAVCGRILPPGARVWEPLPTRAPQMGRTGHYEYSALAARTFWFILILPLCPVRHSALPVPY